MIPEKIAARLTDWFPRAWAPQMILLPWGEHDWIWFPYDSIKDGKPYACYADKFQTCQPCLEVEAVLEKENEPRIPTPAGHCDECGCPLKTIGTPFHHGLICSNWDCPSRKTTIEKEKENE